MVSKLNKLKDIFLLSILISPLVFASIQPFLGLERYQAEGLCLESVVDHFEERDDFSLKSTDPHISLYGKVVLTFSDNTVDSKLITLFSKLNSFSVFPNKQDFQKTAFIFSTQGEFLFSDSRAPPSSILL